MQFTSVKYATARVPCVSLLFQTLHKTTGSEELLARRALHSQLQALPHASLHTYSAAMQAPPSSRKKPTYDVIWRQYALGLEFTPNERDEPVICQIPDSSSPDILQSPASVGDVLVAFQPRNAPVERVRSFRKALKVLQRGDLPIALRFVSRQKDSPERVAAEDVVATYTFVWQAQQPLGVSLAMDPCSLHTAITRIDPHKISPAFQRLAPQVGDVLVRITSPSDGRSAALDSMRFEDLIRTLREFPRPSQLTFARLVEDVDGAIGRSPPASPSHAASAAASSHHEPERPQHPRLRPIPFASRQSFRIEAPVAHKAPGAPSPPRPAPASGPAPTSSDGKSSDSKFFKVIYGGGSVGLQLRDCSHEDSETDKKKKKVGKTKTKGYSVCIKAVTDARSAPGLEHASPGDLLMAIGRMDLQYLTFEQVHRELGKICTPTELLFKKRALAATSGGSLVDALFLFLI